MKIHLSPHTLIFSLGQNRAILYQSALRRGTLIDYQGLILLLRWLEGEPIAYDVKIRFCDLSCFSLEKCLLDDPSGIRLPKEIDELPEYAFSEILEILKEAGFLSHDLSYLNRRGKRFGMFDREHIGNFHQQLGTHVLFGKRSNPEMWWIEQKFDLEPLRPGNSPYRWVQEAFLERYFQDLTGERWLDFGCGIGYYTDFLAKRGATSVIGIDPSEKYISIAQKEFSSSSSVQYRVLGAKTKTDLNALPPGPFDGIFLSDVLLYYFEPYQPLEISASDLLQALAHRLSEKGRICILDPHPCFHLQPWVGSERPSLLCTEYRTRFFRVTPSIQEMAAAITSAGLTIVSIQELYAMGEKGDADSRTWDVVSEFPLWWFLTVRPI